MQANIFTSFVTNVSWITAIFEAAIRGQMEFVQILIGANADEVVIDTHGTLLFSFLD